LHYYPFNIGDFNLHTSHLTLEEEAVYRRLLDFYYDTEAPIPIKTQRVIRRLRLGDYTETVKTILEEYFLKESDGWHNLRADIEINEYHKKADIARANGKKGGRPKKNSGLETERVILANPDLPIDDLGIGCPSLSACLISLSDGCIVVGITGLSAFFIPLLL